MQIQDVWTDIAKVKDLLQTDSMNKPFLKGLEVRAKE